MYNGFELDIQADRACPFIKNNYRYVGLPNGAGYKIILKNYSNTRADVKLEVDGVSIGKYRLNKGEIFPIERTVNKAKKLIFVDEHSDIAYHTGNRPYDDNNGVIKATFYPEKDIVMTRIHPAYTATGKLKSGVTVLGGASSQKFGTTTPIENIDYDKITTIALRLVVKNNLCYSRGDIPPRIDDYYYEHI